MRVDPTYGVRIHLEPPGATDAGKPDDPEDSRENEGRGTQYRSHTVPMRRPKPKAAVRELDSVKSGRTSHRARRTDSTAQPSANGVVQVLPGHAPRPLRPRFLVAETHKEQAAARLDHP